VGAGLGLAVTKKMGEALGALDGPAVATDGDVEGYAVGIPVGLNVGTRDGISVGAVVGTSVGAIDGVAVGG